MPTEKKKENVQKLRELLEQNPVLIATDYRGLTVSEMTALRRKLREQGIEYHVVKNTLASRAAQEAGREALVPLLQGPIALGFSLGNEIAVARAFLNYIASTRSALTLRGAVVGDERLDSNRVGLLASLPPREVLQAQVLGQLQAPLVHLVYTLKAPLVALATVLKASLKEREEREGG